MFGIKEEPGVTVSKCVCCFREFSSDNEPVPEIFDLMTSCFSMKISNDCNRCKSSICPSCVQRVMASHRLKCLILDNLTKWPQVPPCEDELSSSNPNDTRITDHGYNIEHRVSYTNVNNIDLKHEDGSKPSTGHCERSKEDLRSIQDKYNCRDVRVNVMKIEHLYNIDTTKKNPSVTVKSRDMTRIRSSEVRNLVSAFDRRDASPNERSIPFVFKRFRNNSLFASYMALRSRPNVKNVHLEGSNKHFKCTVCSKTFSRKLQLTRHTKTHAVGNFKCSVCAGAFKTAPQLETHVKRHTRVREFHCDKCPKGFTSKIHLAEHQKRHGAAANLECPLCRKSFATKEYLNQHQRTHSDVRNFRCDACNKAFKTKGHLVQHARVHEDKKNKPAEVPKTAKTKSRRREGRKFQCSECSKTFTAESNLKEHAKHHGAVASLKCPSCSKSFVTNVFLKNHLRVHNKVRKYQCTECSSVFKKEELLNRHAKEHKFIYKCTRCPETFKTEEDSEYHTKRHGETCQFVCAERLKSFTEERDLMEHVKDHGSVKCPYDQNSFVGKEF